MDMKEIAYFARIHLQSLCNTSFKLTHIYELLVASLGYKSYAAFDFERFKTECCWANIEFHDALVKHRCLDLGYEVSITKSVIASLKLYLKTLEILDVELDYGFFNYVLASNVNESDMDNEDDDLKDNDYWYEADTSNLSYSKKKKITIVDKNHSAIAH